MSKAVSLHDLLARCAATPNIWIHVARKRRSTGYSFRYFCQDLLHSFEFNKTKSTFWLVLLTPFPLSPSSPLITISTEQGPYIDCYWWSIRRGRICGGNAVAAVRLHICSPRPDGLLSGSVLPTLTSLSRIPAVTSSAFVPFAWSAFCGICMYVNATAVLRSLQGVCLRMVKSSIGRRGCKYIWQLIEWAPQRFLR